MKIVFAIDSFKGSLSTLEAGYAAARGILRALPDAETVVCPLADGGEGTVDAILSALNGERVEISVTGPLGDPVLATYGYVRERGLAVMEMSSAAGITLVPRERLDPLKATTYGVGEMIAHALSQGCREILMGIGGSATNDGGAGMLQALGFSLLDERGEEISRGAAGLEQLSEIRADRVDPALASCRFRIACDVTNPLCGPTGCSAVFGRQKGATELTVPRMDAALRRFAALTRKVFPAADENKAGVGAAGGLGFALFSYLGASLEKGAPLVCETVGLEERIATADLVITGEGRLDSQSAMGKAPAGVAAIAKKYGLPVLGFSGCVTEDAGVLNNHGIDAFFPILRAPCTVEQAMEKATAARNLEATAEQAMRLWLCAKA